MARIVDVRIHWDEMGPEYAKYRLYVEMEPGLPDYGSQYIETTGTELLIPTGDVSGVFSVEGTYNLAVTGFDAAGNESDLSGVVSSPFDFTAPAAPTGLGVEYL
jgi:hypothetical protein